MQIRSLTSDLGASVTARALSGIDSAGGAGFASLLQQSQATPAPVPPDAPPPPQPPAAAPLPSQGLARLPVQPPAPAASTPSPASTGASARPSENAETTKAPVDASGHAVDAPAGRGGASNAAPASKAASGATRTRLKPGDGAASTKGAKAPQDVDAAARTAERDAADRLSASTDKTAQADASTAPAGSAPGSGADAATSAVPVVPPALPTPTASMSAAAATPAGTDPSSTGKDTASPATDGTRRLDLSTAKQDLALPGATAGGAAGPGGTESTAPRLDAGFAAVLAEHRDSGPESAAAAGPADAVAGATPSAAAFGVSPSAPAGAAQAVDLPTPVASPDFAQHLGTQLSVLAKGGVQQAELHLNPADMGPVSVQITMDGTQARIDFGADVAATRHAIEAGLPQLAGALADAGFTLAGGGVSQHAGGRGQGGAADGRRDAEAGGTGRSGTVDAAAAGTSSAAQRRTVRIGGLDLYA